MMLKMIRTACAAAVVLVSSLAAQANVALQINASASDPKMQGRPFEISVSVPRRIFPDPAWYSNQNAIPPPDTLFPRELGRESRGSFEVVGLPEDGGRRKRMAIFQIENNRFLWEGRTFYRVKLTSERFTAWNPRIRQNISAIMIVNMTDRGQNHFWHICVRDAATGEIVFQSGNPNPSADWTMFGRVSGGMTITPVP